MYDDLREHKKHGDSLFPIAVYPVSHTSKQTILQHHWHDEFELIYLDTGSAIFTNDGKESLVHAGDLVFVNSSAVHSAISIEAPTLYHSIVFHPNVIFNPTNLMVSNINTNPDGYHIQEFFPSGSKMHEEIIHDALRIIHELENREDAYQLFVKSHLLAIFAKIFRYKLYTICTPDSNVTVHTKKNVMLKQILNYIYENYASRITIPEISTFMNLTPQYLCSFFKEMTDTSIVNYINQYRIDSACIILRNQNLKITDAAIACGFDNISYFNRVFHKLIGCTPTQYRHSQLMQRSAKNNNTFTTTNLLP